jgi:hypothetical protein
MKQKWKYFKRWIRLKIGKLTNQNPYELIPSGFCPVQIEGHTNEGNYFYFRSRHNLISFAIYANEEGFYKEEPLFERTINYGKSNNIAGWLMHEDAIRLTTVWLNEWYGKGFLC